MLPCVSTLNNSAVSLCLGDHLSSNVHFRPIQLLYLSNGLEAAVPAMKHARRCDS